MTVGSGEAVIFNIFKKYPAISRIIVFVALPAFGAIAFAHNWLSASLPQTTGTITVEGIHGRVSIVRDSYGVPSIKADTDADAFFGIGFAHGQDRLWQLELQRRMAYGRLSEMFGRDSVSLDVWLRTLGFRDLAESAWRTLDDEAKASLTSYAAGVNAARNAQHKLPAEFQMLGIDPEPWTPYDSLASIKLLALDLGGNYHSEIRRLIAARSVAPSRLPVFFPDYPVGAPITTAALDSRASSAMVGLLALQKDIERQLANGGKYVGSNAWVVSGRHTASGAPLLANDPHMGLQIPSLWYAVSATGAKLDVSGMTLAGLPVVIVGRNAKVAWGVTSMMADTQDLYFEQSSVEDPSRYRQGDTWKDFDERTEIISVQSAFPTSLQKPLEPIQIQVRRSAHGPIVSDALNVLDQPVALRWPALDEDDSSYEAFFRLNYAGDWQQFQDALARLVAPTLNVVYADNAGNIGYVGAGRIPRRRAGDGALPQNGWDGANDWLGYVPATEMPRAFNPPEGYIVNANNKIVPDEYPYLISREWAPPARANRIIQLLRERMDPGAAKIDVDYVRQMQGDTLDLDDAALLPTLLAYVPTNSRQVEVRKLLKAWSGKNTRDSSAATLFHAWTRQLREQLLSEVVNPDWSRRRESSHLNWLIQSVGAPQLASALKPDAGWCSVGPSTSPGSCNAIMDASLDAALRELDKLTGTRDIKAWTWGSVHRTYYTHRPFSQFKILDHFFERSIEAGGSSNSINVASATFDHEHGYAQHFGPSFRQVIDVGNGGAPQLFMNSTGQSGNVMDPHYDDMIEPFRDLALVPLNRGDAVSGSAKLTLEPASK